MNKEKIESRHGEPNYLQKVFHAYLIKRLESWTEAKKWAKANSVNEHTMKGVWYDPANTGVSVISNILSKLLELNPEKVASIVNAVKNLEPIPHSTKIWNSLDVPEAEKIRLAQISRAILEIEAKTKKDHV